jgi:phosphoenolpyruvate carboxylase
MSKGISAELREDVRETGHLLGEVIAEQVGQAVLDRVEEVRGEAIAWRDGDKARWQALRTRMRGLDDQEVMPLVSAFSSYFSLVNLLEKVHRIRRARSYSHAHKPQPESLLDVLRGLARAGVSADDFLACLRQARIEPVFTAHPTEARRRLILEKEQRMARLLRDRMNTALTPLEFEGLLQRLRAELTSRWQTDEHPPARPTVGDEHEQVVFAFSRVIYPIIPHVYESLARAIREVWEVEIRPADLPRFLRFGSWVGGDMDGNPNVGPKTLMRALRQQRDMLIAAYAKELAELADQLTQSPNKVGIEADIARRTANYEKHFPRAAARISARHDGMPYRKFLTLMQARLSATRAGAASAYGHPDELTGDLRAVELSLLANRGEHAGHFALSRLISRVETFGFHLAAIDLRQDSMVHRQALAQWLGEPGWLEASAETRLQRLDAWLSGAEDLPRQHGQLDEASQRVLDVFRTVSQARKQYGEQAIGVYIVSMTQGADDLLTVSMLARLAEPDAPASLAVVPLLETIDDLEAGPGILKALLKTRFYHDTPARSRGEQMIMLGYSDSCKDGSLATARWSVYQAQRQLQQAAEGSAIKLRFFHGRGGSVSRGGGKTSVAIRSGPPKAVDGHYRLTEQGEVIHLKFGLRSIAWRYLEQISGAVFEATLKPSPQLDGGPKAEAIMSTVSAASRAYYRDMVYDDAGFPGYFRSATPIDVLERMRIGSRPAKRRSQKGLEDLRAIPWVFSWMQSRHALTGWFGMGAGLEQAVEEHGEAAVSETISRWPFFNALVSEVELAMSQADMAIAAEYATLDESAHGPRLYQHIRAEYRRCRDAVLRLRGNEMLLADRPIISRTAELRNPYIDPMSLLQVRLLGEWRASDRKDDHLLNELIASVNGIALGLQNTG